MPLPDDFRRPLDDQLQRAARRLDVQAIRAALAAGADPESQDHRGWTPLMIAAMGGGVDALRALLDAGVSAAPNGWREWSAICIAARYGHASALRLLAEHGADIDGRDSSGYSIAALACMSPSASQAPAPDTRPACLAALIELGADLSTREGDAAPLACICVMEDSPSCLALLAANGCPLDEPNGLGLSPCDIADSLMRHDCGRVARAALEAIELASSTRSAPAVMAAPRI